MKSYACYDSSGKYIVVGICATDLTTYDIPDGCSVFYGDVSIVSQYHNTETNIPANKGSPPETDGYKFNYASKSWGPDVEYLRYKNKFIRDQLLLDSDWTDTLSAKTRLGQELYDKWQTYRQALRDVPEQTGYPLNAVFPISPSNVL
jgi:Phage tail assembly chaperone protein